MCGARLAVADSCVGRVQLWPIRVWGAFSCGRFVCGARSAVADSCVGRV